MQRYFFYIAYAGTHFHGWQLQSNASTVQGELIKAFKQITSIQEPEIVGCGRTDTGVHSRSYYFHIDMPEELPCTPEVFVYRLNAVLHRDIVVYSMIKVHAEAHARFDPVIRTYKYYFHHQKNPFLHGFSTFNPIKPDIAWMNVAAQYLIGKKDFTSFSKLHTNTKTNVCEVYEAFWEQEGEQIVFTISANRFLRNMVRAIVGTLLQVGEGKDSPEFIDQVLKDKNRCSAGFSVPAEGLFLHEIKYPYPLRHD
jgi:tRNA pseudouridine38-40 synthase